MSYENQKEIDAIRADVLKAGMEIDDECFIALDKFITGLKEKNIYNKLDVLHAPPFATINLIRE